MSRSRCKCRYRFVERDVRVKFRPRLSNGRRRMRRGESKAKGLKRGAGTRSTAKAKTRAGRKDASASALAKKLNEALQQQAATAEVLKIISRSTFDLQTVLNTLVESAGRLCAADQAGIRIAKGGTYHHVASYGYAPEFREYLGQHPLEPDRASIVGRVITERKVIHVHDWHSDPGAKSTMGDAPGVGVVRTILGVPMLRDKSPLGVILLIRRTVRPFTDRQIELVTTFANQAVIAIENVRTFDEIQASRRELAETLEQQTATSEVLSAIASSRGDLSPVFDTLLANALRLCEAQEGILFRIDGGLFETISSVGVLANALPTGPLSVPLGTNRGRIQETIDTVLA